MTTLERFTATSRIALAFATAMTLGTLNAGCSLPLRADAEVLTNTCTTNGDCSGDGVCNAGLCTADDADLSGLLLQIDMPVTSPYAPGRSFVVEPAAAGFVLQGQRPFGYYDTFDIALPPLSEVSAQLKVSDIPTGCSALVATDDTFPASYQLYPRSAVGGLPLAAQSFRVDELEAGVDYTSHTALTSLVPGDYDVVVVPLTADPADPDSAELCGLPPLVLRGRTFAAGSFELSTTLLTPRKLTGTIGGLDLTGWVVDMVENQNGRVISTQQVLEPDAALDIAFWPEVVEAEGLDAVVRVRPPEQETPSALPTVLLPLAALDLDGDYDVAIDLTALSATPLPIEGAVISAADSRAAPATIVLQSEELLDGQFGDNAVFQTTVATDADGGFALSLLPGKYAVSAIPSDPLLAVTRDTFIVSEGDLGAGKTVQLLAKVRLDGRAVTPTGAPASNLSAFLQPAAAGGDTLRSSLYEAAELQPNTVAALTLDGGAFEFDADPGVFDLTLRPPDGSDLPWLAIPRLNIAASDTAPTVSLSELSLAYPVAVLGDVRGPDGATIANAQIRAWLPRTLDAEDPSGAQTVIQIGEALADGSGAFELLLPPSIAK